MKDVVKDTESIRKDVREIREHEKSAKDLIMANNKYVIVLIVHNCFADEIYIDELCEICTANTSMIERYLWRQIVGLFCSYKFLITNL